MQETTPPPQTTNKLVGKAVVQLPPQQQQLLDGLAQLLQPELVQQTTAPTSDSFSHVGRHPIPDLASTGAAPEILTSKLPGSSHVIRGRAIIADASGMDPRNPLLWHVPATMDTSKSSDLGRHKLLRRGHTPSMFPRAETMVQDKELPASTCEPGPNPFSHAVVAAPPPAISPPLQLAASATPQLHVNPISTRMPPAESKITHSQRQRHRRALEARLGLPVTQDAESVNV
jgi:hypothetical protein